MRSTRFRTGARARLLVALLPALVLALLVPLGGIGAAPAEAASPAVLRISPTSFDFGSVALGTTSPPQTVTVTNVSAVPVVLSGSGGAAGLFGGSQDCQGTTVQPGASCHMTYAFTPDALGQVTGSTAGDWNGQSFAFSFTGTGVNPFLISPTGLDFGDVAVGATSPPQTVTITNISNSPLAMSGAGGAAGQFGGSQDCQGTTLKPGASCHMTYAFTPTALGPVTDSTSGDWNGQPFSIVFAGTGIDGVLVAADPTISGTPTVGQKLMANTAGWTPGTTFVYQWNRGASPIPGATGASYTPVAADAGSTLTVAATGSQPGYPAVTRTSAATATVRNVFTTIPTPAISGTAAVGKKLTTVPGAWSPTATLAYQWKRGGSTITGATSPTYTLTNADAGQTVTVTVTGSRSGYVTASRTSAATATITGGTLTAPTPTITGTTTVGQKLTANPGTWTTGTTLTYQWNRGGVPISGATASYHTLNAADGGHTITVTVTGSKTGFTTVSKTSTPTVAVLKVFTTTPTPTISGAATVGSKLTAKPGAWSPTPTAYTYVWLRSGVAISGATSSTYTLKTTDAGKKISVTVTATRQGYAPVSKTSASTAAVT
ncbi:choice-of-anchor D domain-containing protein [Subtercola sp. YIM 133946]|uniref:choice-of-anchor D domain-containing protein n=1 Tax=Subtercola sp. YIM 133946 TaxID=3118909 RepID=UPI002F95F5C0